MSRLDVRTRLQGPIRRFARQDSGSAVIEFAILVPILVILIYAVAEYSNAIDNRNKVSALTRTLADLVSQGGKQNPISAAEMSSIAAAAEPVLAPFPASRATMTISAVGVTSSGSKQVPYICSNWSTATKPKTGLSSTLNLPTNFQRKGARFVLAEVSMPYQPLFATVLGRFMTGFDLNLTWTDAIAWPVRGGQSYASGDDPEIVLPDGQECRKTM
ncbi:MAG: pilus assembly protein [Methylorubrum populi]